MAADILIFSFLNLLECSTLSKSMVAINVAKRLNGEIVNADAFQMYKGLDIATAKVSDSEVSQLYLIPLRDTNVDNADGWSSASSTWHI